MSGTELATKLREYKSLKEMMNELQDSLSAIEDEIKQDMGENEELNVEGIKIKWTRYISSRFDSGTFKKEHTAMYEQYLKNTEARRFSVA